MRAVMLHIFKYLLWALFIIAVLLYMSGYEIQDQAVILLGGVVAIDIVFAVAGLIYKGVAKYRRSKKSKSKASGKKSKTAGEGVVGTVKETGAALKDAAESTWDAIKEKSGEVSTAIREKLSGE